MDEADFYDEFGNYIGPAGPAGSVCEAAPVEAFAEEDAEGVDAEEAMGREPGRQVVLHEDKKYYPSALEVYGAQVQVLVEDEDRQALTEPIIAPLQRVTLERRAGAGAGAGGASTTSPATDYKYDLQYLRGMAEVPARTRRVAFVGHLHHGKTALIDLLLGEAQRGALPRPRASRKAAPGRVALPRAMDSLLAEEERGISLRAKAAHVLLPDAQGCTHVLALVDAPGHADLREEAAGAVALLAGALVLVVDSVEGVQAETEACVAAARIAGRPVVLVLSKMERLWLELRLPPADAYFKLRNIIDRLNTLAGHCLFAPERGNVVIGEEIDAAKLGI